MKKLKSTIPKIKIEKKPGVFNLKFTKDEKNLVKTKLSKQDVLNFYFIKLEDNIKNNNYSATEIYNKYKQLWKKYNLKSTYIDSWGHIWENCFISDKVVYKYINDLIDKLRN
jgi:hypothetical protein